MSSFTLIRRLALVSCAALTLAGCESVNRTMTDLGHSIRNLGNGSSQGHAMKASVGPAADNAVPCPPVIAVGELDALHQFTDDTVPIVDNSISSVRISGISSHCTMNGNNAIVDIDIDFEGKLGPQARKEITDRPVFDYPYFVAITTNDGQVLAKEVFGVSLAYEQGQNDLTHKENLRQIIPAQGEGFDQTHELLIGFQLTDAQLAYNRAQIESARPANAVGMQPVYSQEDYKPPVRKKKIVKPPLPAEKPATEAAPVAETPAVDPAAVTPVEAAPAMTETVTETAPAEDATIIIPPTGEPTVVEETPDTTPAATAEETTETAPAEPASIEELFFDDKTAPTVPDEPQTLDELFNTPPAPGAQ